MMIKKFKFVFIFFSMITCSIWGTENSVVEPYVKWNKSSIKVCWGDATYIDQISLIDADIISDKNKIISGSNNDSTSEYKEQIKKIIQQEYQLKKVGIEFIGWEKCPLPTDENFKSIDLVLLIKTSPPLFSFNWFKEFLSGTIYGEANIGQNGYYATIPDLEKNKEYKNFLTKFLFKRYLKGFYNKDLTKKSFVLLTQINPTKNWSQARVQTHQQLVALHEFGHIAGMRHEHTRSEIKSDQFCQMIEDQAIFLFASYKRPKIEPRLDSSIAYGNYDPYSVMSYCYLVAKSQFEEPSFKQYFTNTQIKNMKVGLSNGDIHALRCLYNNKTINEPKCIYSKPEQD